MLTNILIGLGIGLAGSFHCIGMCGPLALSLPLNNGSRAGRILSILLYNAGRTLTYFLLGVIFGLLGNSFALVGYQQALSVAIGFFILFILFFGNALASRVTFLAGVHNKIKLLLGNLLRNEKNTFSYLIIGMVNGLLPCGLVYLAMASAVATGSALGGGVLMLSFGIATIPLMFALMVAGRHISVAVRENMRKLVPIFVGLMACMMILRGLNLGIPYISPAFDKSSKGQSVECHTPADSLNAR